LDESLDVQWDNFINAKVAKDRQDVQFQDGIIRGFAVKRKAVVMSSVIRRCFQDAESYGKTLILCTLCDRRYGQYVFQPTSKDAVSQK
jgi:hypothetical protein